MHKKGGYSGVKSSGGGVVNYCVHGPSGKIMATNFTPSKLVKVLRGGLPVQEE